MESKEKEIRTFVAVPLEPMPELLEFLHVCRKNFSNEKINWVKDMQMHFTLKFIGDTREDEITSLTAALENVISGIESFDFSLKGIGTFGRKMQPSVLWCRAGSVDSFRILHEAVCSVPGLEDTEKYDFVPHLTLGRIKYLKDYQRFETFLNRHRNMDLGVYRAVKVVMFRSDLQSTGPVYSEIASFHLTQGLI